MNTWTGPRRGPGRWVAHGNTLGMGRKLGSAVVYFAVVELSLTK